MLHERSKRATQRPTNRPQFDHVNPPFAAFDFTDERLCFVKPLRQFDCVMPARSRSARKSWRKSLYSREDTDFSTETFHGHQRKVCIRIVQNRLFNRGFRRRSIQPAEEPLPHDIATNTGRPAMAYRGAVPWHRLGEELPEDAPIEDWLRAAQLEWELERQPVQYFAGEKLRAMKGRFVLVRNDTHDALSIVSEDYKLVQPKEVLEFYRDLIDDYGYKLETAGALNGGRKVWALARTELAGTADRRGEDELAAYVLFATSCDKTLATTVAFTSVRVVCQNTLSFAIRDTNTNQRPRIKVPHNLQFDAEDVKAKLDLMNGSWSAFLDEVGMMVARPIDAVAASSFFEGLLPHGRDKRLTARAVSDHQTLMSFFKGRAPGQKLASAQGTLWGALNAVTYYADHVRSSSGGDRLDSAWFGTGFALKERAWAKASEMLARN
jgi:phage/plasmid-like protein (TIGR03299 family)